MAASSPFTTRRAQLATQIGENALAIISSSKEQLRNGDVHYRFRQNSHFYYLTGFNEPDAVLVIQGGTSGVSLLFNRPRNPEAERWTGPRLGQTDAVTLLNVDAAYAIDELPTHLLQLCQGKTDLYYLIGQDACAEPLILNTIATLKTKTRAGISKPSQLHDIEPLLSGMRLLKDPHEIALIQQACDISVAGHQRAMQSVTQCSHEYELEATLLDTFTRHGARQLAYDSIVAAGKNACTLHYTDNHGPLRSGDLVLIDAACEVGNYAADITRTFPINGTFSGEQRALYDIVLQAQRSAIALVKPGLAWPTIQQHLVSIITEGLRDLEIIHGSLDTLIEKEAYKPFYMHSSGHWLGLDVHDAGTYKMGEHWQTLAPHMVFTVEPGLYISEQAGVDPKWWNIGIRIEDDILVTPSGHINLTDKLPVDSQEIEALIRG